MSDTYRFDSSKSCKDKVDDYRKDANAMKDFENMTERQHVEDVNERIREFAMENYNGGSYAYCLKSIVFFYSLLFWIAMIFLDVRMLEAPGIALIAANCVYCICDFKRDKLQAVKVTNATYLVLSLGLGLIMHVENPIFAIVTAFAAMPFGTQLARAIIFARDTMRD